ncbi:MAG: hypothetical protein C4527_05580 [Candidatus Omnitrophota bacterium]|jgi:hypothetical protein|nr:MAG: hypothetical protein C4527_05580 [Candidatus Omnitrophota bacterium]
MKTRLINVFDSHKLLIFFTPFLIYMLNGREISSGDPTPTVFVSINALKKGTIFLDDLHDYIAYHGLPYYVSEQKGHLVSNYPIFPGIMAVPIFAPFVWLIDKGEGDLVWKYVSKLSGATYTSLAVLILYLTLRRLIQKEGALVLAGAYALGTALWPIASQSLWQHGPGVFWWSVCFYYLIRFAEDCGCNHTPSQDSQRSFTRYLFYAGAAAGFATLCRTVNGIGAVALSLALLCHYPRRSWSFIAPAVFLTASLIAYNVLIFDSWKGGDVVLHSLHWELDRVEGGSWSTPLWVGFPGQLISPSRGLLIFSPFLIFALWGMVAIWKKADVRWRMIAWTIPIPIIMLLVFGKYAVWWGGNSHYGPRYQIEAYPFLMLYLAAVWPQIRNSRTWMTLFLVLLCFSVFTQWVGAFCYPGGWAVEPTALSVDKGRLWDWSYNQILTCLRSGIKWPYLLL